MSWRKLIEVAQVARVDEVQPVGGERQLDVEVVAHMQMRILRRVSERLGRAENSGLSLSNLLELGPARIVGMRQESVRG